MSFKNKIGELWQALHTVADTKTNAAHTFLALSVDGRLSVESFKKLLDYQEDRIVLSAGGKTLYIYGDNLKVLSYNKYDINITGKVTKFEIFEVK